MESEDDDGAVSGLYLTVGVDALEVRGAIDEYDRTDGLVGGLQLIESVLVRPGQMAADPNAGAIFVIDRTRLLAETTTEGSVAPRPPTHAHLAHAH